VSYHERPGTTGPDPLLAGVAQSQVSAAINISLCLDNVCSGKVEYIELDVPGNNQGPAAQHFLLNYTEVATFIGITVIRTTADPVPKFTIRFLPERVQAQVAELRKTESDTTIANLVRTKKLFGYKEKVPRFLVGALPRNRQEQTGGHDKKTKLSAFVRCAPRHSRTQKSKCCLTSMYWRPVV
jgi:hypothetical protein